MAQDEVALPARVGEVATQAVLFLDSAGPEAALAMVEQRVGGWFDPDVAATWCSNLGGGGHLRRTVCSSMNPINPATYSSL